MDIYDLGILFEGYLEPNCSLLNIFFYEISYNDIQQRKNELLITDCSFLQNYKFIEIISKKLEHSILTIKELVKLIKLPYIEVDSYDPFIEESIEDFLRYNKGKIIIYSLEPNFVNNFLRFFYNSKVIFVQIIKKPSRYPCVLVEVTDKIGNYLMMNDFFIEIPQKIYIFPEIEK